MRPHCWLLLGVLLLPGELEGADTFAIGSYNLENYLLQAADGNRPAKPPAAKAKIRESIHALNVDVLALQEIGDSNALIELQRSLKTEGLDYSYWAHASGADTNIFVAVLSKFPIVENRSHTNESFLLNGRRYRVSRGFLEVEIEVSPRYRFTLFSAHLKSKRVVLEADEEELREQEAILLREKIDQAQRRNPAANIVVAADLNDYVSARSTKAVLGRGRSALIDTRPAEPNGDNQAGANPEYAARTITWTHFFGRDDLYSRLDYILLNGGMAREWITNRTRIVCVTNWGLGSDHRPIRAAFQSAER